MGVSVHSLRVTDNSRKAHQYQQLDERDARSLALRHISTYFSEVGEYFGHASGLVSSGPEGMDTIHASSDDSETFRSFEVFSGAIYSPLPIESILDTSSFPDHLPGLDEAFSGNIDQISQLQLQQSWSEFLSHL